MATIPPSQTDQREPVPAKPLSQAAVSQATSDEKDSATQLSIAQMRIDSIKSGLVGAGIIGGVASGLWGIATVSLLPLPLPQSLLGWLVNLAVALCSGFFFGVTYRYIVRQDDNLHLGSGAVGAFAFVRSLAQIEATWDDSFALLTWLLVIGESFLWFATARYALDWTMAKRWLTPLD
ncbi:MAG: hypothetical protein AAFP03_01360 [Cyanobacteria bacterium J06598_3]